MIGPNPTELGAPFWAAAKSESLTAQVCTDCGTHRLPAALRCPQCHSFDSTWQEIPPRATVLAITTVHRAGHPALADLVPYRTCVVSLGSAACIPMLVAAECVEELAVGDAVRVGFARTDADAAIPVVLGLAADAATSGAGA